MMMSEQNTSVPYEKLGAKLRRLREQHRESMAEVSGAVEIDESQLERIESGHDRPAEDILLLLISHYGIEDDHAAELWKLAGYEGRNDDFEHDHTPEPSDAKQRTQVMMIMLDPRVIYSDSVEVIANNQGVVMNFSQIAGMDNGPLTVARVGMSYDHAKEVMGILHRVLYDRDNPGQARRLNDGKNTK